MAAKNDKAAEKPDKQKQAKPGKGAQESEPFTSIATHPRASIHVRKAKGVGGLAGFAVAALLSLQAGVTFTQMLERALIFGIVGYLVLWALSMLVWRQLMLAEQKAAYQELESRQAEMLAKLTEARAAPAKAAARS